MRWRILTLLFLARTGLGFQFQTVASVGKDLIIAFGLDHVGFGLMIGLFMAPGLVLVVPAGYWARYVSDLIMVVFRYRHGRGRPCLACPCVWLARSVAGHLGLLCDCGAWSVYLLTSAT